MTQSDVRPAALPTDGARLRQAFEAATRWLELHAAEVNSLNVFPVPDGDTGTNMLLTMKATIAAMAAHPDSRASVVAQAMAHGALMGARGNSGVILSQILRGFARSLDAAAMSGPDLARALRAASETAYQAVSRPVEGTILTVAREAAAAADHGDGDVIAVLERAVAAAREAVDRTPSQLPILAEAGVVDAGGQGLYYLLEGALRFARGEQIEFVAVDSLGAIEATIAAHHTSFAGHPDGLSSDAHGYCTEFLISGDGLDQHVIEAEMAQLGDSLLVVGDSSLLRVHVHTFDPGKALTLAIAQGGTLDKIKIDNMQAQRENFVKVPQPSVEAPPIGVVAVAAGAGLSQVLQSFGVRKIVTGGQTMNPSTEDFLKAVAESGSPNVILLPNNKNIVGAAMQAAAIAGEHVQVVPSLSLPQGVAAMLAYNPEGSLDGNVRAMTLALGQVRTGELTRAVRTTSVDGIPVVEGQIIGLVEGRLAIAEDDLQTAMTDVLARMRADSAELITLYYGDSVGRAEAEALQKQVQRQFSQSTVDLVDGGQPHYAFIISVE